MLPRAPSARFFAVCALLAAGSAATPDAPTDTSAPPAAAPPASATVGSPPSHGVSAHAPSGADAAPSGGSAATTPSAAQAPPPGSCVELLPSGRARPKVTETFPARGLAGYETPLVVEVEHLPGERLLPGGVHLEAQSDEAKQLAQAHFALPHPSSDAAPRLESVEAGELVRSKLTLPLVPLPTEPGRRELTLPSLPIAMARASGEVFILCTQPHAITVEDPIANDPDPTPRTNPAPRRQLEVWQAAKTALVVGALALVVGVLFAWLLLLWRKRPRRTPPAPPPRPPWEVAEESLQNIESSGLIRAGQLDEHFDRVSQTIRKYLGDRYGFDGLESTSREALRVLDAVTPRVSELGRIKKFLQHADLVKFARLTPSEEECGKYLQEARTIVTRTLPHELARAEVSETPAGTEGEP